MRSAATTVSARPVWDRIEVHTASSRRRAPTRDWADALGRLKRNQTGDPCKEEAAACGMGELPRQAHVRTRSGRGCMLWGRPRENSPLLLWQAQDVWDHLLQQYGADRVLGADQVYGHPSGASDYASSGSGMQTRNDSTQLVQLALTMPGGPVRTGPPGIDACSAWLHA
jgi:hypothetical protein